jgi:hypothetical protein
VAWESEPVTMTANQALAADGARTDQNSTAKDDAIVFLRDALTYGPVAVSDLEAQARAAGYLGDRQRIAQCKPFRSARDALNIEPRREGFGPGSRVLWSLPDST